MRVRTLTGLLRTVYDNFQNNNKISAKAGVASQSCRIPARVHKLQGVQRNFYVLFSYIGLKTIRGQTLPK